MIKNYKTSIRKNLKGKDLCKTIAERLRDEGIVEVIASMYLELYNLKVQLMNKGVIEPETAYLLGEIYEHFSEEDKKKLGPN